MPKSKVCTKCGIEKPLIEGFSKDKRAKFGRSSECRACKSITDKAYRKNNKEKIAASQRKYRLNNLAKKAEHSRKWRENNPERYKAIQRDSAFGKGAGDYYNKLFKEQKGCCAICGRHQSQLAKPLGLDHNHITGQWRKLLCSNCNFGIGNFRDSPELCYKAFQYLKSFMVSD